MTTLLWIVLWLAGFLLIAYHRFSLLSATIAIGIGLLVTTFFSPFSWFTLLLLWGLFGVSAFFLNQREYQRKYFFAPLFNHFRHSLPPISETEKIALEAGTVSWDRELFNGCTEWEKLLTLPKATLTAEEEAFLTGPVQTVCEMVNEWEITHQQGDLPPPIWAFLKENGFFGLVIPKEYGGKGFSEFAHSEILTTLAGRSLTLAITVSVPNSLGPAELIRQYGTPEQRQYYLPRLAKGEEIPCFALTGPAAGSDATALPDIGIVCKQEWEGQETLGILLNWNKRYITLAPIATLIGLAFKLRDPDHLLGEETERGITCALIPRQTPGITIGRRHFPLNIPFQNGPIQGENVFIPLNWIIGGPEMAGHGWRMLIECLSTGRAISLPSLSSGGALLATFAAGAYGRVRHQFRTPLCTFEGVQAALAKIGGLTYLAQATRYLTVAMIDAGEKPTVPGAITKYHVTEMARKIANAAMDVLGGKGIMLGPKNYVGRTYQGIPIAITVEGANILTRSMIIFGQGVFRCHPYLLREMQAIEQESMEDFEHYVSHHVRSVLANGARALWHGLSGAKWISAPAGKETQAYFQQLGRASYAFALVTDATLMVLGGRLKIKEAISARLSDLLSFMYLMSAVLKHYHDQGKKADDLPLLQWSMTYCLAHFWHTLDALLHNFPNRLLGGFLRCIVMPLGLRHRFPQDKLVRQVSDLLTTANEARTHLINPFFLSDSPDDPLGILKRAFDLTTADNELLKRVYHATKNSQLAQGELPQIIALAQQAKIITDEEATRLFAIDEAIQAAIAVDDFASHELSRNLQALPHP